MPASVCPAEGLAEAVGSLGFETGAGICFISAVATTIALLGTQALAEP